MPSHARSAILGAAGAVVLLAITWYAAFHIGFVEHADRSILRGFFDLHHRARIDRIANFVARLCDPKPYVYFAAVPVLVAVARGRPRVALAVVAILLGANLTTQLLKPLLAEARLAPLPGEYSPSAASWPSGHATAAMSLALCCVLAAPARLRPLVASLGAAFAVAVSYSFLTLGWHYPSDVFGGYLVAAAWTLTAISALLTIEARNPRRAGRDSRRLTMREALGPPAAAVVGAILAAGLVVLARPHQVVAYARAHEAFMVGAAAIGVLALALATGIVFAVRR
jgi:membrane-associated phospholipid phosphatase